jgi:hypothetical protein
MWSKVVITTNTHIAIRADTTNLITWTFFLSSPYTHLDKRNLSCGSYPSRKNALTVSCTHSLQQTWSLCVGTLCTLEASVKVHEDIWSFSHAWKQAGTAPEAGGITDRQGLFQLFCSRDLRFHLASLMLLHPHALTGDICITYPPELTKRLLVPLTKAQCKMEGIPHVPEPKENIRRRKQTCNEVQGQCW